MSEYSYNEFVKNSETFFNILDSGKMAKSVYESIGGYHYIIKKYHEIFDMNFISLTKMIDIHLYRFQKKENLYSIIDFHNIKFEESTFKDFFNSLRVDKDTSKLTKNFVINYLDTSIESKKSNAVSFNEAIRCLLKGKIAVTCSNDNKLCFLIYHEIEKKIYFIYPVLCPSSSFLLDALFSEDELCDDKFIKISEEYTFFKRNDRIFKIYDSFEDFIYKDCIFEVYMNKTTQYPKTISQKEVMNTMVDYPYSDDWKKFRDSGLLWFVNSILHVFGWNIVLEMENGKVLKAYPQRTKYRGFSEKSNTKGYINLSQYMKDHADELLKEAKDE